MGALRSPKLEAFAREVAGGQSAQGAWVATGHNAASRNVGRLMRQPKMVARIAELRAEFNGAAGIHVEYLKEKYLALASADVTRFFESERGRLKLRDLTRLPAELRAAITEVRLDADGRVTVKVANKIAALDSLMKAVGGFGPQNDEGASGAVNVELLQVVAKFEGMSELEIARRIAFAMDAGTRQIPASPAEGAVDEEAT